MVRIMPYDNSFLDNLIKKADEGGAARKEAAREYGQWLLAHEKSWFSCRKDTYTFIDNRLDKNDEFGDRVRPFTAIQLEPHSRFFRPEILILVNTNADGTLKTCLGSGGTARVRLGYLPRRNEFVAVKKSRKTDEFEKNKSQITKECENLMLLGKQFYMAKTKNNMQQDTRFLISALGRKDGHAFLGSNRSFRRSIQLLKTIVSEVADLHDKGWVHRDLKLENILEKAAENPTGSPQFRLMDFASAAPLKEGYTESVGVTPLYLSPELKSHWLESNAEVKCLVEGDNWALTTIVAMLFFDMTDLVDPIPVGNGIQNFNVLSTPSSINYVYLEELLKTPRGLYKYVAKENMDVIKDIVKTGFNPDVEKRLSAKGILEKLQTVVLDKK